MHFNLQQATKDFIILDKTRMTDKLFNLLYSAKTDELHKVCATYFTDENYFKQLLKSKLMESNMHAGACNLAVDFLITETSDGTLHDTLSKAVSENILGAAIYYANCCGKNPVYTVFIMD